MRSTSARLAIAGRLLTAVTTPGSPPPFLPLVETVLTDVQVKEILEKVHHDNHYLRRWSNGLYPL